MADENEIAVFSPADGRRIAAAVRQAAAAMPKLRRRRPRKRRAGGGRPFAAAIGEHADADAAAQNRYDYEWWEVEQIARADAASAYALRTGGRNGTTTTDPARNTAEDGQPQVYKVFHSGTNTQALTDTDASPYGNYFEAGTYGGKPYYLRTDGAFAIWWYATLGGAWCISSAPGVLVPGSWLGEGPIEDTYDYGGAYTGTLTVALADMPAVPPGTVVQMHYEIVDGTPQPVFSHAPFYGQATFDPPLPAHIIVMWSGAVGTVPGGWTLCDGGNDSEGVATPDLSGRFIVSYESGVYAVGDTGGDNKHGGGINDHADHTAGTHKYHTSTNPSDQTPIVTGDHSETDNRPAYYTLAFIWKD